MGKQFSSHMVIRCSYAGVLKWSPHCISKPQYLAISWQLMTLPIKCNYLSLSHSHTHTCPSTAWHGSCILSKIEGKQEQSTALPRYNLFTGSITVQLLGNHRACLKLAARYTLASNTPTRAIFGLSADCYLWEACKTPAETYDWLIPSDTIRRHPLLD